MESRLKFGVAGGHQTERLRSTVEKARIDLRRGDFDEVIEALTPLVAEPRRSERHPSWLASVARALLGRARVESGSDPTEGRQLLEQAVAALADDTPAETQVDPEDAADLAAALRLLGRYSQAVWLVESALGPAKAAPWRVRLELGRCLHLLGQDQQAVAELTAALEEKPGEPFILLERARCLARLGQAAEATSDASDAAAGFIARDRLREADDASQEALRSAPEDPAVLCLRGEVLLRLGDPQQALEYAEQAIGHRADIWAQQIRAYALYGLSRPDEALAAARAVLAEQPADVGALEISVDTLAAIGQLAEAIPLLDAASRAEPETAEVSGLRGRVLVELGEYTDAERDLTVALERNPGDLEAAQALSIALAGLGRPGEAADRLRRFVDDGHDDPETLFRLGEALRLSGDLVAAHGYLDQAVEQYPWHASALGTRGQVRAGLDRTEEAITDLARAEELAPGVAWILSSLAQTLVAAGRIDEGVAAFERYVDAAPDRTLAEVETGEWLATEAYYLAALPFLRRAAEHPPMADRTLPFLLFTLAMTDQYDEVLRLGHDRADLDGIGSAAVADALRGTGAYTEAVEWADRALALEPELSFALYVRGNARRMLGDVDAADADLVAAAAVDPENVVIRDSLADLRYAMGRYAEALPLLERAAGGATEPTPYDAVLADTLLALGRTDDALVYSERAVRAEPEDAFALGVHGQVLRMLTRDADALPFLDRALASDPALAWVRTEKVLVLTRLQRTAEAVTLGADLVREAPENAFALGVYGNALSAEDRSAEALAAFEQSLQVAREPWVEAARCGVLIDLGRRREAVAGLEELVSSGRSDDLWTRMKLASAYLRGDPPDPRRAIATVADLGDDDPNVVSALTVRGDAHLRLGERGAANLDFEAAIERAHALGLPDSHTLHAAAWCMLKLGRIKDAARNLLRALDKAPYASTQLDLGLVMLHSDRPARAVGEYRRGIELAAVLPDAARRECVLRDVLTDLELALGVEDSLKPSPTVDEVRDLLTAAIEEATAGGRVSGGGGGPDLAI